MSPSRKPAAPRSKKRVTQRQKPPAVKGRRNQPPDLEPVLHAFWDAASVLRLGVEALAKVSDQLDAVNTALHYALKNNGVVKGGAS